MLTVVTQKYPDYHQKRAFRSCRFGLGWFGSAHTGGAPAWWHREKSVRMTSVGANDWFRTDHLRQRRSGADKIWSGLEQTMNIL